MDSEVTGQAGSNDETLIFDVPDDALERAATAEQKAPTYIALMLGTIAGGHSNLATAPSITPSLDRI